MTWFTTTYRVIPRSLRKSLEQALLQGRLPEQLVGITCWLIFSGRGNRFGSSAVYLLIKPRNG